MSVLQEIIKEATAEESDVPRMLRLCLLLGKRLRHAPLTAWVQHELEGYPEDMALPSYRILHCRNQGTFRNGTAQVTTDIPMSVIPEPLRFRFETAEMRESIGELAHLLAGGSQDRKALHIAWPPEVALVHASKASPNAQCVSAWSLISVAELAGALDQIKSKVLGFALDIEQESPDAGDIPGPDSQLKEEKVTQIFNTNIHGGTVQNLANGSQNFSQSATSGIQPGDLSALLTLLRNEGLPEREVTSLRNAIESDNEADKGSTVTKWIGDLVLRATTGAAEIGLDKVTSIVVPAVMAYLGA